MKMKNLLAVLSAGAIAVSSLSVAAFADTVDNSGSNPAPAKAAAVTKVEKVTTFGETYAKQTEYDSNLAKLTITPDDEDTLTVNIEYEGELEDLIDANDSESQTSHTALKVTLAAAATVSGTDTNVKWNNTPVTKAELVADGKRITGTEPADTALNTILFWVDLTQTSPITRTVAIGDDKESTITVKVTKKTTPAPTPSAPTTTTTAATEEKIAVEEVKPSADDAIPEGASLAVKVEDTSAITVPEGKEEVVEKIEKLVDKGDAAVLDIKLVDKKGEEAKVAEGSSVTVSFKVPSSVKIGYFKKVFVYRAEADGTFTDMKATLSEDRETITFATVHFSTYIVTNEALDAALVNSADPTAAETTTAADAAETTAADATTAADGTAAETTAAPAEGTTGDKNQATGVALAIVPAVIAAAGVVISKKRK